MLGTNDSKVRYKLNSVDIAKHLKQTIKSIKKIDLQKIPKILILCPPSILTPSRQPISKEGKEFDKEMKDATKTSEILPKLFIKVAEKEGCDFIDLGKHISSSRLDGCHLDADMHEKLAYLLKDYIFK